MWVHECMFVCVDMTSLTKGYCRSYDAGVLLKSNGQLSVTAVRGVFSMEEGFRFFLCCVFCSAFAICFEIEEDRIFLCLYPQRLFPIDASS